MKLGNVVKCFLVFVTYLVVLIWISTKIWGEPKSTYEKLVHQLDNQHYDSNIYDNIKYKLDTEYLTKSGYFLFQISGYEIEINQGIGEFSVDSVILESEDHMYSVDIFREKLDVAERIVESDLKTDKIAFRAVVPMSVLMPGRYKLGLLLSDNTVVWSDKYLSAMPYLKVIDDQNKNTVDNEIGIFDDGVFYDKDNGCLTGVGGPQEECEIVIGNNNNSKSITLSFQAHTEQTNTYFLFVCNDITIVQDMHQGEENIELVFPLVEGDNTVYVYFLTEDNDTIIPRYDLSNIEARFS